MSLTDITPEERASLLRVLERYEGFYNNSKMSRNTIGYANKTYVVEIENRKRVLREAHPDTATAHLRFEVEILQYLETQNYPLSPRLVANKDGQLLTEIDGRFYTLQNFMPGNIRASWNDLNTFEGELLYNLFKTVADFSKVVENFQPQTVFNNEPLSQYVRNAPTRYEEVLKSKIPLNGRALLNEAKERLLAFAEETHIKFRSLGYDERPKQLVHFDFHPGNVHYQGNQIVAVFDYDWARLDCRTSDIASAITQSCYVFGGPDSGKFIKSKIHDAVGAYCKALSKNSAPYSDETELIQAATQAYAFFQLLWAARWYEEHPHSPEGLPILKHFRNVCLLNDYDSLFS